MVSSFVSFLLRDRRSCSRESGVPFWGWVWGSAPEEVGGSSSSSPVANSMDCSVVSVVDAGHVLGR